MATIESASWRARSPVALGGLSAAARRTLARQIATMLAIGLAFTSATASAEVDEDSPSSGAFARYDIDGERTVRRIARWRFGRPVGGAEVPAREAVRAAMDLWLISFLAPEHDHLAEGVAGALGVPLERLATELEIAARATGDEALSSEIAELVELHRRLSHDGSSVRFTGSRGLRRDALLIDAAARALWARDRRALADLVGDPCASEECSAPWTAWRPESRAEIAGLLEASAAWSRLRSARRDGDVFARAIVPLLRDSRRQIQTAELHPEVFVADGLPIGAAPASEDAERPRTLVAVGRRRVAVVEIASVKARDGVLVLSSEEPISVRSHGLPRSAHGNSPVSRLTEAFAALDAPVSLAIAHDVPSCDVARVLASLRAAGRGPARLVGLSPDRRFVGVAIEILPRPRDGYLIVRSRADGLIVRDGSEIVERYPNDQVLAYNAARLAGSRVVLEPRGTREIGTLLDTLFTLGQHGGTVAVLVRSPE